MAIFVLPRHAVICRNPTVSIPLRNPMWNLGQQCNQKDWVYGLKAHKMEEKDMGLFEGASTNLTTP